MKNRSVAIDVLRSIAVFTVMFRHIALGKDNPALVGFIAWLQNTPVDFAHLPKLVLAHVWQAGWAGVDLFFVLSGYLVSGLLFREYGERKELRVKRFLVRRGLKIYPAFYVFLVIGWLGMQIAHKQRPPMAWLCEALFIQNYGAQWGWSVWGHTWSLAVEEHFYVLLVALLYFLAKRGGPNPFRALPRIFALVAVAVLGARIATAIAHPELDHITHYFPTHLRIDALFFGVLLSYFTHFEPERLAFVKTHARAVAIVSALLVLPTFVFNQLTWPMYLLFLPTLYVGCGGLLLTAIGSPAFTRAPFTYVTRPMAFIGLHSYSIYVWHAAVLVIGVPIIARVFRHFGSLGLAGEGIIYVVGCLSVGIITARLIELPILRLRDRKVPDPT